MAVSRREVDEEILIAAVQQRPCIWDSRDVACAARDQKNKAGDKVVTEIFPEWASLPKSQQINKRKAVQTQWRSLKDCYTRELCQLRDVERSGSSPSKRKQYLCFEELDFLRTVLETRRTSGNLQRTSGPEQDHDRSDAPPESTAEASLSTEAPSATSSRQRRRRANEQNLPLLGQLSSLIEDRRLNMEDPNYHFHCLHTQCLKNFLKIGWIPVVKSCGRFSINILPCRTNLRSQ